MLCFVLGQSYVFRLDRLRSEFLKHTFKCSGNICVITPMKYFHLCKVILPFLPCVGCCLTFTNRKLSLLPSCLFSPFLCLSSFTGCILLPMTSIPPTFLLPPPPPSYISYKYFPFSFQWELMLIKWCTKSSAAWAWRKPSRLSSEAFAVVKALSKPSSLSETFLLSSITNSSEKNTSLHFAWRCLYTDRHVGSMMTFCNRR